MRDFDAHAVAHCRIPSLLLMENAGAGATEVLVREFLGGKARGARIALVCGGGNNGGDGLVIARHLAVRGALPLVVSRGQLGIAVRRRPRQPRCVAGNRRADPGARARREPLGARRGRRRGRRDRRRALRHGARPSHRGPPGGGDRPPQSGSRAALRGGCPVGTGRGHGGDARSRHRGPGHRDLRALQARAAHAVRCALRREDSRRGHRRTGFAGGADRQLGPAPRRNRRRAMGRASSSRCVQERRGPRRRRRRFGREGLARRSSSPTARYAPARAWRPSPRGPRRRPQSRATSSR